MRLWPVSEGEDLILDTGTLGRFCLYTAKGDLLFAQCLRKDIHPVYLLYENGEAGVMLVDNEKLGKYVLLYPPKNSDEAAEQNK